MNQAEVDVMVAENGMVMGRAMADGSYVAITPMTYGNYRLVIGTDPWGYDDGY